MQIKITVIGRVQGVWFRDTTKKIARELGLKGTVRNTDEGNVEVIAKGDKDKLQQLIEFCRKGPPAARVDEIKVEEQEPEDLTGFEIKF